MPNSGISPSESDERAPSDESPADKKGKNRRTLEKISDYEKVRLKRIEENKLRMEALGLRKMANSLACAVQESPRKGNDGKGKKKMVDEDEEYNPEEEEEDNEMSSSSGTEDDDEEFSPSSRTKKTGKRNISTPKIKKRGLIQKPVICSDFVEDDDDLMRAIALSLQDSGITTCKTETSHNATANNRKEKPNIRGDSGKRKRKTPVSSRVQMSEDEILVHFLQFDETGTGSFSLRDVRRLSAAHDFTWSEKEMADMITCFDNDGDGKINFDDFHKIVSRCNKLVKD